MGGKSAMGAWAAWGHGRRGRHGQHGRCGRCGQHGQRGRCGRRGKGPVGVAPRSVLSWVEEGRLRDVACSAWARIVEGACCRRLWPELRPSPLGRAKMPSVPARNPRISLRAFRAGCAFSQNGNASSDRSYNGEKRQVLLMGGREDRSEEANSAWSFIMGATLRCEAPGF